MTARPIVLIAAAVAGSIIVFYLTGCAVVRDAQTLYLLDEQSRRH